MDVVKCDRLSNLPDDLIYKILGFVDTKQVVQTSCLSSRWRYIWTSMPYLNLSISEFTTLPKFAEFVTRFLSSRNNQIQVCSLKLVINHEEVSLVFLKIVLDYAISHNVQQLDLDISFCYEIMEIPLTFFSSESLKHLTLRTVTNYSMTQPAWKLPALETLNLHDVTFYDDNININSGGVFSNCANLKNLTLTDCTMMGDFNICHPRLSSLTLENGYADVNVITPQLKTLVIERWHGELIISAPNVSSFHFSCCAQFAEPSAELSADFLHLEDVDICISHPATNNREAYQIVCLLQQLHSVKFLTLNLEMITLLSEHVELISHLPSPFSNLKSLKIYPCDVFSMEPEVPVSTEVKNFLIDSSPGATFTVVPREEVRAMMNVSCALGYMMQLQNCLNGYSKTNMTELEEHMVTTYDKVEVENHRAEADTKMKGDRITHVNKYWKDLNAQLKEGYKFSGHINSLLGDIEAVLPDLPTSHRDKLQTRFSGLFVEAETVMTSMMNRMRIQCEKTPGHCLLS